MTRHDTEEQAGGFLPLNDEPRRRTQRLDPIELNDAAKNHPFAAHRVEEAGRIIDAVIKRRWRKFKLSKTLRDEIAIALLNVHAEEMEAFAKNTTLIARELIKKQPKWERICNWKRFFE